MVGNTLHEELARIIVKDSLEIDPNDIVTITTWEHTIDVANAIAVECSKRGAEAIMLLWTDEYYYGLFRELPEENLQMPSNISKALAEAVTATINIWGPKNPEGQKNFSSSKINAWMKGRRAERELAIQRKIRNVDLRLAMVTPERAKTYGFNFEKWKNVMNNALTMDLKKMAKVGREFSAILEKAHTARLIAPNGTNLTFELGQRPVHINDGIIDEEDMAKVSLNTQLPSGSLLTTIVETSGNGKVISDQPLQAAGLNILGLELQFKEGKLTSMTAKKNLEPLSKQLEKASGDKDKISSLVIGLNPKAEYGYLIDHIVEGAVQIGVGDNKYIGGKNSSPFETEVRISKATLEIDGKTVIRNGRLSLK